MTDRQPLSPPAESKCDYKCSFRDLCYISADVIGQANAGGDGATSKWPRNSWESYAKNAKRVAVKTCAIKELAIKQIDQITSDKKAAGELY